MVHYDVGPLPAGMNALHQGEPKPFFKGGPVNNLVPATITSPQNGQPHAGTPTMVHYDVGPLPAGMNALNQGEPKPFFKGGPVNNLVPATITSPQNG